MWKSKQEIRKTYIDHIDSVQMSGFGHSRSRAEILSFMFEAEREFDEGRQFLPFSVLTN